jgi:hypothetical protein
MAGVTLSNRIVAGQECDPNKPERALTKNVTKRISRKS